MENLKNRNTITILGALCIIISICAGIGYGPAAESINGIFHMMFPQMRDPDGAMFTSRPQVQLKFDSSGARDTQVPTVIKRFK